MIFIAMALAAAPGVATGNATLVCVPSTAPADDLTPNDFYDVLPATKEQFIEDIWELGLVSMATAPATSWVIDYDGKTVTEVESGFAPLAIIKVTPELVEARSGPGIPARVAFLNRVTGKATLTVLADVTAWTARFGGKLTGHRTWNLDCRAAEKLF